MNNKKWQTEPFTENILRQLQEEPKVLLQDRTTRRNCKDHNVPDISNVANYEECLSSEDIYISKKPKTHWKKSYDDAKDIEEELKKMFVNELEQETPHTVRKSQKNKKVKRDFLIHLFGSPLDDIGPTKELSKTEKVEKRRHSFPISIDINQILTPEKVTQKRKSETDVHTSPKKVPKVQVPLNSSIEELDVEYERLSNLVVPPVFREVGRLSYTHSELEVAVVGNHPVAETSTTVKQTMESPFIDLTEDGDDVYMPPSRSMPFIKSDHEMKMYSSEQADVPISSVFCSVPSPVSPAEPTQAEAVLAKSSQRPPPMTKLQIGGLEITPVQSSVKNSQTRSMVTTCKLTQQPTSQVSKMEVCQKPESVSHTGQTKMDNYKFMRQHSGGHMSLKQQSNDPGVKNHDKQRDYAVHWKAEKAAGQTTRHSLPAVLNNVQQWQNQSKVYPAPNQNPFKNQYLPNLSRLYQVSPTAVEYELITNTACAERMFPHVFSLVSWRMHATSFHEKTKMFALPGSREIEIKLYEYCEQFAEMFGVNMIKSLSSVDVHDFAMFEILTLISKGLANNQFSLGMYRVCHLLNLMVTPARPYCTSPFLKKFYNAVKLSLARLEEKTTKVPVFTPLQLKCLEMQIKVYLRIEEWLKTNLTKPVQTKRQYKKKNPPPIINILQHTVIRGTNSSQFTSAQSMLQASALPTNVIQPTPNRINAFDRPKQQGSIEMVKAPSLSHSSLPNAPVSKPQPNDVQNPQLLTNSTVNFMEALISKLLANSSPSVNMENVSQPENLTSNETAQIEPPSFDNMNTGCAEKLPEPRKTTEVTTSTNLKPEESQQRTTIEIIASPLTSKPDAVPEDPNKSILKAEECKMQDVDVKPNEDENGVSSTMKNDFKFPISGNDDVIDLTWVDDLDEVEILEDIIETKSFPFKIENSWGNDEKDEEREVISPSDSGVGSPPSQNYQNDDGFKCLCGNKASYVCACNSSMYCSRDCQEKDWMYHQKLCHKMKS